MVDFQSRDTRRDGSETAAEGTSDDHTSAEGDDHEHEHDDHGHHEHDVETLGVAVVTISSTRSIDDDPSGDAIRDASEAAGHEVVIRELVRDDHDTIQRTVANLAERRDVDAVVTTGGTGVTPDDVTIEAVRPLFRKTLPGFGELFRRRSESDIGTRVIATRASAGITGGVPVFCLPGSRAAAELGVELVLAEAGHISGLAGRDRDEA